MTTLRAVLLGITAAFLTGSGAQPVCSINIGPDRTICQGEQVTLNGPPGYSNYLWSNGATTPSITVSAGGNYWCQVSYPTGNMVVNGDFSAGNTGFSSGFTWSNDLYTEGHYYIGTNANALHNQWQGVGNGPFLMLNAGFNTQWSAFYCVNLNVCPGQTYTMSWRMASLATSGPPEMQWIVSDGTAFGNVTASNNQGQWTTFNASWTATTSATNLDFCMQLLSGFGIGNDIGLDNISFAGTVILRDTVQVIVNPLPVMNCGGYGPACVDAAPIPLNGLPAGGTWAGTGAVGNTFDAAAAGVGAHALAYTYTDANGCTNSCSTTITVNALPIVDCGAPGPFCVNAPSAALGGAPAGGTWSGAGVAGNAFDPATAGSGTHGLTYTYTDANACTNDCTVNVQVHAAPALACGTYGPFCVYEQAIALGGSPAGGSWSGPGVNGGQFAPGVAGSGTHTLTYTYTDGNGCTFACTTDVVVNPMPIVVCPAIGPLCNAAAPVALNALPAGGSWSGPGVAGGTFDPQVAGSGNHPLTYIYSDANGCSSTCQSVVVVNPQPAVACGNYGPFCADAAPIALGGVPAGGSWSGTGVNAGVFNPASAGAGTHTLQYTFTDANGCSSSCSTNVTVNPVPVVDAGASASACANDAPIALPGSPAGGAWSGNGVVGGAFDPAAAGIGTWNLTYAFTDANGCQASDAASYTVSPLPTVDIGPDQTVCPGTAVTFNATTTGATYVWQDGSTGPTFTMDQPGAVSVTVTTNGCSATDGAVLNNFSLASVNLGPDQVGCVGTPIPLSVNIPGATYQWSTGATTNVINAGSSGWYWVDALLNGCAARDSIFINLLPLPVVNLGLDRMVCPGATALLNATTPGATYAWSDGSTAPTLQAGIGTWSVTVTVNGCSSSDAVNVGNWTPPIVDLGADTTLCPGQPLVLNATTPFVTYSWQDGSTAPTLAVQQAGTYAVTLTDTHGCTASDAINVAYTSVTPVDLGPDTTICAGTSIALDATTVGATFYQWNNGFNNPTLPVSGGGLYWVDVSQNGCQVTDSIVVVMQPLPAVDLGADTTLCPGNTLLLNVTAAGDTYLWQDGSTDASFVVSAAGTYHVSVTDIVHCTGADTIVVAYASPDALELGADTSICNGTTLVLDATLPGSSYAWSTGSTAPTLAVNTAGTYSVTVTQGNCPLVDQITIGVLPAPSVELGNDTTLCDGATLILDAGNPGAAHSWSDGSTAQTLLVTAPGTYAVTVDLNGCAVTDAIQVDYVGALAFDLGPDTTLCPGTNITLTAQLPGGSTVWSTNANGPQISVNTEGIYWANINVQGCVATDSIAISYVDLAPVDLGADAAFCIGEAASFDITQPGATYLWDDGSTDPVRTIDTGGAYWARVMLAGCEVSDTVLLTLLPLPVVDLGSDTGLCAGATLLLDVAQPGGIYLWSDGSTTPTLSVGPGQWSVTVTVNGCQAGDAIAVASLPTPALALPADTTLCTGTVWVIDAEQPGATYLWQDGSTLSGFLVQAPGSYSVDVSIGTCTVSDAVQVSYFDASVVDLGPDTSLCPGATLVLELTLPGVQLTWPDGSNGQQYTVASAGTYTVLADANGCTTSDAITVSFVPLPIPDLGDDRTLCSGDSVTLTVVPGGASVLWSNGSEADSVLVTTSGNVQVTLSLDGCAASDAVQVFVLPRVNAIDLGDDATVCPDRPLVLDATTHLAQYAWSTGDDDASLAVTEPGTYIVTLTGPCIQAVDTVVVTEGDCAPLIHIPNAFSPNGDGMNDVFLPVIAGDMDALELLIFDRWGSVIFTANAPGAGWNGEVNGTPAQDGVYVWMLTYKALTDGGVVQKRLTGHVTLLR